MLEPSLAIMLLLKAKWSLTGELTGSSVHFSTGWFDSKIALPQVSSTPERDTTRFLDLGGYAYRFDSIVDVNSWVRGRMDTLTNSLSNTSLGIAKKQRWDMREEVYNIIFNNPMYWKSDSNVNIGFIHILGFQELDHLEERPPLFRVLSRVGCIYQRVRSS